jgi:superfamily II DNA or RNA helicase
VLDEIHNLLSDRGRVIGLLTALCKTHGLPTLAMTGIPSAIVDTALKKVYGGNYIPYKEGSV